MRHNLVLVELSFRRPGVQFVPVCAYALVALTLLGTATPSSACPGRACGRAQVAPLGQKQIPVNVPALYFEPSWNASSDEFMDGGPPMLVTSTGAEMPLTLDDDSRVTPAKPLTPGEIYEWRYREVCEGFGEDTEPVGDITQRFQVVDPVPLPQQIGELKLERTQLETREVHTVSGSCTSPVEAMAATVTLNASVELATFLPLTEFRLNVTGYGTFATSSVGERGAGELNFTAYTICHSDDENVDEALPEGVFELTLSAQVFGTDERLVSNAVSVELRCPERSLAEQPDASAPLPELDAAASDMGDAQTSSPDEGRGPTDAAMFASDPKAENVKSSSRDEGCAVSAVAPQRRERFGFALLLGLFGLLASSRRLSSERPS